MAKQSPATLRWSAEHNSYTWCEPGGQEHMLHAEQEMWHLLLGAHSSFSFQGRQGHLSLLKENRQRGGGYWYAYRRQGKRTHKQYAGRTGNITFERLEALAQKLGAHSDAPASSESLLQGEYQKFEPDLIPTVPQVLPLLAPKLRPPRQHSALVARERLLALLDTGLERKLTLISAPAGFGKTTLVSQWLMKLRMKNEELRNAPNTRGSAFSILNSQFTVAWLSLDPGDNDPSRFWHYLIAACQTWHASLGQAAMDLLQAAQQPAFPRSGPEALLTALLNDLAQMPGRGVLVLEDYHLISEPEIQRGMQFFVAHQPANLHLILITRSEPPLPLAQLRAHDDLLELGVAQLRFTPAETRALLQQTLPTQLSNATLDHLQSRTEGWAAGLRLITLALQGQEQQIEQRLATMRGSQRHLLDYLVAEVLAAQDTPLQLFLLQTTGLARLTGSLCDAVTERNDSASLLEQIERTNLFLTPLDEHGQWYRYHALFAEAMQHEARRLLGDAALRACASRASRWYEQHRLPDEAIEAALAADEAERAAALIMGRIEAQHLLQMQELHTLQRWLGQLPAAILGESATLSQAYAMVLLFNATQRTPALRQQIEAQLGQAERTLQAAGDETRLGEALALHALLVEQLNDLPGAARCARQALGLLPAGEAIWRNIALGILSIDAMLAGRFADAELCMQEAWRSAQAARRSAQAIENSYGERGARILLAYITLGQGDLRQAEQLFGQVIDSAGDDRADRGIALVGRATLAYEWNQLAAAEQDTRQAIALSQDLGYELLRHMATLLLARVLQARGQAVQAQQVLQRHMIGLTEPRWQRETMAWQAWLAWAAGDLTSTQCWNSAGRATALAQELSEAQQEREALLDVRIQLARTAIERRPGIPIHEATQRHAKEGNALENLRAPSTSTMDIDMTDVLAELEHWRAAARSQARIRSEVEILVQIAKAHASTQQMQAAQQALVEALTLAQPAGYQRLFLDEGVETGALLRASIPGIQPRPLLAYARSLLRAFAQAHNDSAPTTPLLELLSPQEQRVLRLLAAGRSNAEIARELIVSINTVKAQIKSIYRKLGVSSRLEASEAARQLQIL